MLAKYGLVWDTWHYHMQIDDLTEAAATVPHLTIVMDHCGSPLGVKAYKKEEVMPVWKESIRKIAQLPNVHCKLSGLTMPLAGHGFEQKDRPATCVEVVEALSPYYLYCIEQFGVSRCMFASNFPMDRVSCSYATLYNAFKTMVKDFSEEDKHALFYSNAVRIYGLENPPLRDTIDEIVAAAADREVAAREGRYWPSKGNEDEEEKKSQ